MFSSVSLIAGQATAVQQPASLEVFDTAFVDLIDCGLCACTENGILLRANSAASQELASGRALKIVDGYVRCVAESQSDLLTALADAATKQKTRLLMVGKPGNRLPLVTTPIPLGDLTSPAVLLMLGQRALCSALATEMLAGRYALTHMERRVLGGLLHNHSPREIADAHSVSLSTVRTQIQSLREKMCVRSVEELLLVAAQMPPVRSRFESRVA